MKKKKKKFKKAVLLLIPLLILYYLVSFKLTSEIYYYNSSKSSITYIVYGAIIFIALLIIIFTIKGFKLPRKNKTSSYIWYFIFLIIFIIGEAFLSVNLDKVSNSISKLTNKESGYSSSLVALSSSKLNKIENIKNEKIGIISDVNNTEGYIIPMEIVDDKKIKQDNLVNYDSFIEMIKALYNKEIDLMFISSSYVSMFSTEEGLEDIASKTKVIYEKNKKKVKERTISNKSLKDPFTVLIMGVDSDTNSLSKSNSFNGDTLILMTFNPNTMNATILSIPRDTRVPIVCTKSKGLNKINSSAYYGADCVMDTVTNLTGVKIDYWVKVNFQGVIKLVDALGGIKVDVPYAFCESNETREFGNKTIFVEKGKQTLDGRKALAFARNRHPWPEYCPRKYSKYTSNDFVRGQNQQQIIKAMTNKLKGVNKLSQIYDILDIVGDNIDTNIDKDTIITGYDMFKNIIFNSRNVNNEDFIGTQRLYLSGSDKMISGTYYFEYSKKSLKEITNAMKINLELKKPDMDKDFSFSINDPYEEVQIGK